MSDDIKEFKLVRLKIVRRLEEIIDSDDMDPVSEKGEIIELLKKYRDLAKDEETRRWASSVIDLLENSGPENLRLVYMGLHEELLGSMFESAMSKLIEAAEIVMLNDPELKELKEMFRDG